MTLSKIFAPRDLDVRVDTNKQSDENEGLGNIVDGKVQQPPEPAFKRLHILYLVHDLLMHSQSHARSNGGREQASSLAPLLAVVETLAQLAVCGCGGKAANTCHVVLDLISFWEGAGLFSAQRVEQLRRTVHSADGLNWETALDRLARSDESRVGNERRQREDDTKWILPDRHGVLGDYTAPWHELPAANGLYLKRTRGYPLRANALPPGGAWVQNGGDEADPQLKQDVLDIFDEVVRCYDKYTPAHEVQDIDALGNIIWKDPERPTRNYWGFTLDGIDKRKELAAHFAESTAGTNGYDQMEAQDYRMGNAVERARALAAERGRGGGFGGGWRGGRNW